MVSVHETDLLWILRGIVPDDVTDDKHGSLPPFLAEAAAAFNESPP
jgi:hypothetical protein